MEPYITLPANSLWEHNAGRCWGYSMFNLILLFRMKSGPPARAPGTPLGQASSVVQSAEVSPPARQDLWPGPGAAGGNVLERGGKEGGRKNLTSQLVLTSCLRGRSDCSYLSDEEMDDGKSGDFFKVTRGQVVKAGFNPTSVCLFLFHMLVFPPAQGPALHSSEAETEPHTVARCPQGLEVGPQSTKRLVMSATP